MQHQKEKRKKRKKKKKKKEKKERERAGTNFKKEVQIPNNKIFNKIDLK